MQRPLEVITSSEIIEKHLAPHQGACGRDYEAYRGHIYRVLTFAMHYLGTEDPLYVTNITKYRPLIEVGSMRQQFALCNLE